LLLLFNGWKITRKGREFSLKIPISIHPTGDGYRLYKSQTGGIDLSNFIKEIVEFRIDKELVRTIDEIDLDYVIPVRTENPEWSSEMWENKAILLKMEKAGRFKGRREVVNMPISKNISQEHVLKAIEEIDKNGVSGKFKGKSYSLIYNGKRYPPKYVVSLANKYANGEFLDPAEFNTHAAVRYLRRLGFRVAKITPETGEDSTEGGSGSNIIELPILQFPPNEFDKKMYSVFERFASLVEERLRAIVEKCSELEKIHQESEDTIRYMMFHALTTVGGIDPLDVYLEYPHPEVPNRKYAKLDTFVAAKENRPALAFEMKFKTKIPSRNNIPRSQIAGSAFADLLRLASFRVKSSEKTKRYFVYVVDDEMIGYYRNPRNCLEEFFDLETNKGFKLTKDYILFKNKTKTEKRAKWLIRGVESSMGEPTNWPEPTVICRFRRDFDFGSNRIVIRIYEVVP